MIHPLKNYYQTHSTSCNIFLLVAWFLMNLGQAAFTELANDEAYYWVYAEHLDFGYFDHPPAIALLIKAGYWLFQNELGLRFFIVLLSTLTLWFTYLLSKKKGFASFFSLAFSMSFLQVYGFIAVPDVPLLFFTATYFLLYRQYLAKDSLSNALLLGLSIALLLYSKYHGLLVLFFTLMSNLALFKKKTFIGLQELQYYYTSHI